jgi:hypothetical protein
MVRSPGFGSIYYYYGGLFSLAFTMPPANALSLQQQITRWIVLQKARRHRINRLRLLVRTQFQDLFHSPSGVLLTFPSRYLFTIDRKIYLALEGGPSGFSQGFTCPDLLDNDDERVLRRGSSSETIRSQQMIKFVKLGIPGYHRLWPVFPDCSTRITNFLLYGSWC